MEAIIKFDLHEPDDAREHKRMLKAIDMQMVLWDISQELRAKIKYAPDGTSEDTYKAYEEISDFFYGKLNEYSIDLDL
jgi:hypothetical protein